jgi:hypothetical protein
MPGISFQRQLSEWWLELLRRDADMFANVEYQSSERLKLIILAERRISSDHQIQLLKLSRLVKHWDRHRKKDEKDEHKSHDG